MKETPSGARKARQEKAWLAGESWRLALSRYTQDASALGGTSNNPSRG